jgi:hypothetical protein
MFRRKEEPEMGEEQQFVSKRVQQKPVNRSRRVSPAKLKNNVSSNPNVIANTSVWRPNASINNLEQEKKKKVDLEIKEKNRKRRRRIRTRLTLKFSLVVIGFFGLFLLLGVASKRVNVALDYGEGTAYEEDLKSSVNAEVDGGLLGYIRPAFLRYRLIESSLEKQRDEVDKVEMHFNLFRMRTEAEVKTNTPLVKWIGADGSPSYVNQKGQVFEPPTSFVTLFNPLEIGGSGLGSEPGSKVLASSEKLAWAVGVIPVLRGQGIEPSKVNIDASSFKSVELLLPGVETRIIFSIDEDVNRSGVAAARAIKFIEKSGVGGLPTVGYIDVRTPERVLYK